MKNPLKRTVDRLTLENFPLHTEEAQWAAKAPAQVGAACVRGAHVIGLTETRKQATLDNMKQVANAHGYDWYTAPYDKHRNVSLLVKRTLDVVDHGAVLCNNNYRVWVSFKFHGRIVTVYQMHFERTDNNGKMIQTEDLIQASHESSKGSGISVYMGDSNPSKPQHMAGSQPSTRLKEAGMPTVWQELNHFPSNLGVNIVGHNAKQDTAVTTKSATLHDPLGSDHAPAFCVFDVKRRLFHG